MNLVFSHNHNLNIIKKELFSFHTFTIASVPVVIFCLCFFFFFSFFFHLLFCIISDTNYLYLRYYFSIISSHYNTLRITPFSLIYYIHYLCVNYRHLLLSYLHFIIPKIHRSVLRKITINLLHF